MTAFLASVSLSCKLIVSILYKVPNVENGHFVTAIELWKKIAQVDPPSQGIIKQYAWDAPLITKKLDCLLSSAVSSDGVCLSPVSANVGEGSEWLNALPIKNCRLLLSDEELQNNVGLRLGCDFAVCHECSGYEAEVDPTATHGVYCKMSKGRHSRHSEVNSVIVQTLSSAGFSAKLEPSGLSCTDGR